MYCYICHFCWPLTAQKQESSVRNLCYIRIHEVSSSMLMSSSVHKITVLIERQD